jgi:murein DD-endopeptidase MepM/ murein hydrolase activator NlpD
VYGTRRVFNGELKSRHYGLDLRGRVGTPVFSVLGGRVVLVAERFFSGGTVVVDHGGGLFSLYFHLSRWNVKVGDAVARGARIGAVGRSGRVTGPHLHLGVAVRAEPGDGAAPRGLFVDPEPILAGALGP